MTRFVMTKNKLVALGITLASIVLGAAFQQGYIPVPAGVCPPSSPASLDAGTQ